MITMCSSNRDSSMITRVQGNLLLKFAKTIGIIQKKRQKVYRNIEIKLRNWKIDQYRRLKQRKKHDRSCNKFKEFIDKLIG